MEQTLKNPEQNTELIIAGAGPAGISAALYAVRAGITPLILYKDGGALEKAKEIENYYGFPAPISGPWRSAGSWKRSWKYRYSPAISA